jgi:HAD superfamily hydrolase (TIGR01509 family)
MLKALIFDCFGVIYPDTLAIVGRDFLKLNDPRREELRYLREQSDRGLVEREEFWNEAAKIMRTTRHELDLRLAKVKGADWELLEYIKELKKKYKTALLSNVGRDFIERVFAPHSSQDYFDELVLSYEIGFLKPEPGAYETAAQRLGCKPAECLMIDDQERHCKGAVTTGMKALHYKDFDQFKHELSKSIRSE